MQLNEPLKLARTCFEAWRQHSRRADPQSEFKTRENFEGLIYCILDYLDRNTPRIDSFKITHTKHKVPEGYITVEEFCNKHLYEGKSLISHHTVASLFAMNGEFREKCGKRVGRSWVIKYKEGIEFFEQAPQGLHTKITNRIKSLKANGQWKCEAA